MFISGVGNSYIPRPRYSSGIAPVGIPDWEKIPHKGMECPTESEFKVIIDDLGRALAEAHKNGDTKLYESLLEKTTKLAAQYVSVVSPDRKALVKEAMQVVNSLGGQSNSPKKGSDLPLTLLDHLNIKDGIGPKREPAIDGRFKITLGSGTVVTFVGSDDAPLDLTVKGKFDTEPVVITQNGKWGYQPTKQEYEMGQDFLKRVASTERWYTNFDTPLITQPEGKLDIKV